MSEKLFTDVCRIDNLKIRNKNLINQLSKDEVIYLHLHLTMCEDIENILEDLSFPLSLEDFEIAKKRINLKKIKRDKLVQDILDILKEDEGVEDSKWFKTEIFKNPEIAMNHSEFYLLFYNLISREVVEDFKKLTTDTIVEYTSKLSSFGKDKKPEYDCIKSVCAVCLSDKFFEIKDKMQAEGKAKKSKKIEEAIFNLQKALALCVHNNYTLVCKETIESIDKELLNLKNEVKKGNIQLEDKNQKIRELKENLRTLSKQLKDYQKIAGLTTLEDSIKAINERLKNIEDSNICMSKEIKNVKADTIKSSYENQINNYIVKVTDLKKEVALKTSECKELKRKLDFAESNIEVNFINYVESNGLSDKMVAFLKPLLNEEENLMEAYLKGEFNIPEEVENDSEMIIKESVQKESRKVGYVSIENDKHYVNFANGTSGELTNLSEKIYLIEGQFIIVDENNKFTKTTISKYEDNGISIKNLKLGTVESIEPLKVRVGSEYINARNVNDFNGVYKLNQVVGLNDNNQIVRAFRVARFNADTVMKSVKARGLNVYYVLDVFSNDFFKLRNIETGHEDVYKLNTSEIDIIKYAVLFVKDNDVISAMSQGKFYTTSSYYTSKIVHGPVEIVDGDVRITKSSGEVAIVKNIPDSYTINDGVVIAVDEFNNYLYVSPTDKQYIEKSVLKKSPKQVVSGSDIRKPIETKGEVTIVGNPFYKNGYIMAFFKHGYRVNMLHGYDTSINKIVQVAKESEAILVNTSYCSHDNFWQIKDEVKSGALKGIKYVFTQEDGANMLLNRFKELQVVDEVAITN